MVRLLLDQIQWNFLFGGGNLKKKPHLVKWETICMDKKNGGFSVESLGSLDKALLLNGVGVLVQREGLFGMM